MASTSLASGEHDQGWDAGLARPASIGGLVWEDLDANGVQVQASQTVNVTPIIGLFWPQPLKVSARPLLAGGIVDFGVERAVSDLGGPEANGFANRLDDAALKRFHWTGLSAWERDYKQSPPWASGIDHLYTDNVDMTFYVGHGWPGGFTFESSLDDGSIIPTDVTNAWGNLDEEWQAVLSCQVCSAGGWWQWGQAFNGLHLMTCFQTNASANTNFGYKFADWMLGRLFFLPPQTVRASWFLASWEEQPSGRQAVVMGVFGPGWVADYNDYFHGRGPVGPDIPRASITGYWRVVYTVP